MANGEGQQHYRYNTGTSRAKKNKRIPTKRNDFARAGTERVLRHFPLDRSRRIMLVFIRSNIDMLSLLVRRAEERRRPCCGKGNEIEMEGLTYGLLVRTAKWLRPNNSKEGKDERRRLAAFGPEGSPIDKIHADTSFQY